MSYSQSNEKPSLPKLEEEVLEFWEKNQIFKKSLEKTREGKPFSFYDGPPFATGLPHYGHILASTIKDLIPRFQTMRGRFVRRRWGWDCHGLPIEEIVERKLGISGKKQIEEIGIGKFNEACRETVLQYTEEWGKMVSRMGRFVEFENAYKTMDRDYMESVWWAFKELWKKGLIYEGRKVLMYCPRCETPLSNFEVAMDNSYKDVTEEAVIVKFRVKSADPEWQDTSLLAWTTTPWTLPGNVALAVNPTHRFVCVPDPTLKNSWVVLEEASYQRLAKTGILPKPETLQKDQFDIFSAEDLIGLGYDPLFAIPAMESEKSYKVYAADFVTTTEGTGIVHTAVVYGEDDYALGVKVGLPVVPLLDEKGRFNDKVPEAIRGQYFKDIEMFIKKDLESRGLLFSAESHIHSYPHCWRCGTALFYNAIPAWFVNIQKVKKDLIASNNKEINWYPEHLKHGRYEKSVEAAPDWNISRNRYWGNPVPVWKCESCGDLRVAGSIKDLGLSRNTFYFTRHGEAENNVRDIVSSYPEQSENPLTTKGREDARALGERLKAEGGVDIIYSSDLLRTKETAEIVANTLGVNVIVDPRIREWNFGELNGKTEKELKAAVPKERRWTEAPKGGETYADIQKRIVECVEEINLQNKGKKILIVSHGNPLWLLRKYFNASDAYPRFAEVFELDVSIRDLHRPYIDDVILNCEKCGSKARRVPEIFDSWIEAGSMPFAEYHFPFENEAVFKNRYPAQFVAEYIAQTRAWFYVMHVLGFTLFNKAPFENVVTTGTILAEDGSKMSKSKGNFPDPWVVIEKYGVDALRFYLMRSVVMQADNLNFSVKDLENVSRRVCMILWNVYQYFCTYVQKWEIEDGKGDIKLSVLDQWINARTKQLVREVTDGFEGYDTVKATRAIEEYIDDLSTWYLRRSRGRKDSAFFETLSGALLTTSKIIAPVTPFLAEKIYRGVRFEVLGFSGDTEEAESVHLAEWPKTETITKEEKKLLEDMAAIREATSLGQAIRKEFNVPVRQPLACMAIELKEQKDIAPELWDVLLAELNVKTVDQALFAEAGETVKIAEGNLHIARVAIDTAMNEELKREGLVRALERFIQGMRKTQGLKVGEMAKVIYKTESAEIKKALKSLDREKTYIAEISEGNGEELFKSSEESAKFGIKKI